jgi:hypothetical protein
MDKQINRGITVVLLLGFVAIVCLGAGRQGTNAASDVIVTNTTSQPVPVKSTATARTPSFVDTSPTARDNLQLCQTFEITGSAINHIFVFNAIPGERFVIKHIIATLHTNNGDTIVGATASIYSQNGGDPLFRDMATPMSYGDGANGFFGTSSGVHFTEECMLDSGGSLQVDVLRSGSGGDYVNVTVSGYRVSYP